MAQVRLENIRPSDIVEGREKETLALIWAIILHYQSELKWNYTLQHQLMIYGNTWNYDTHCNVQLHQFGRIRDTALYFVVFGIALLGYQMNKFVYLKTSQAFFSIPIHSSALLVAILSRLAGL